MDLDRAIKGWYTTVYKKLVSKDNNVIYRVLFSFNEDFTTSPVFDDIGTYICEWQFPGQLTIAECIAYIPFRSWKCSKICDYMRVYPDTNINYIYDLRVSKIENIQFTTRPMEIYKDVEQIYSYIMNNFSYYIYKNWSRKSFYFKMVQLK